MEPITWVVVIGGTFLLGAAVGHFWDDIKAWLTRVTKHLLDRIDRTIEVVSNTMVYVVKEGKRYYKRFEIFARNTLTRIIRGLYQQEEVSIIDIPEDIITQLDSQEKLLILQRATS
ncbi:MAG: hypothetical protein AAGJ08_29225 [Cyanobacteria bacterium P01_H01_bin.35]